MFILHWPESSYGHTLFPGQPGNAMHVCVPRSRFADRPAVSALGTEVRLKSSADPGFIMDRAGVTIFAIYNICWPMDSGFVLCPIFSKKQLGSYNTS